MLVYDGLTFSLGVRFRTRLIHSSMSELSSMVYRRRIRAKSSSDIVASPRENSRNSSSITSDWRFSMKLQGQQSGSVCGNLSVNRDKCQFNVNILKDKATSEACITLSQNPGCRALPVKVFVFENISAFWAKEMNQQGGILYRLYRLQTAKVMDLILTASQCILHWVYNQNKL